MAGKNVGFFKGLLTVIVLSVLVFIVIFFFFPDLSLKYFGLCYDREKAVEDMMEAVFDKADYLTESEKERVEDYISSSDGKAFIKDLSSALNKGKEGLEEFVSSPAFDRFQSTLGEILSSESYSRLTGNIESLASSLLDKLT